MLEATVEWRRDAACVFDRPLAGQLVYDRMDWSHPNRAGFKRRNAAIIQAVDRLEDALSEDPVQVTFNGAVETMRTISSHLATQVVASHLEVTLTEYPHRDFSMVDICSAGVTKGSGLKALAEQFGIAQSDVMAVGDNHNDRDMLAGPASASSWATPNPSLSRPPSI